jgi:hypothetical protein
MSRSVPRLALVLTAFSVAAPTMAADYPEELRSSYSGEWGSSEGVEPIGFEAGLRYWYSKGEQNLSVNGEAYSGRDTSQILEGHIRIDDYSTDTYLKGMAGYSAFIDGTYDAYGQTGTQVMHGGKILYGSADLGYTPFGSDSVRFGGFVGYQYWNDSPDMGRQNFIPPSGAGDSQLNDFGIHALRLGISAHADLGDRVDINAEAAIIPYAYMEGTYGAFYQQPFSYGGVNFQQGSAGNLSGNLYGATVEVMLGFHPTENITMRVGGRAWYVEGKPRMTYQATQIGTPSNAVRFISEAAFSSFRYGALAELTYSF